MSAYDSNDAPPGSPDHPAHKVQQAKRIADLQFLGQLKTASRLQLLAQEQVFIRLTKNKRGAEDAWKLRAVQRQLVKSDAASWEAFW